MKKKDRQGKKHIKQLLMPIIFIVASALCGFAIGIVWASSIKVDAGVKEFTGEYVLEILLLAATVYLQLILHEAGHLVFGLVSGYSFLSFRIGSLMLLKTEEGFSLKKFTLAGTGGQCLMDPPDDEEKFPFVLYNLGGVIMNLICAAISFVLFAVLPEGRFVPFWLVMAVSGAVIALMNGIPINMKDIPNDGWNTVSLVKTPDARKAFWRQLRVNALQTKGIRLKDMPEEMFALSEKADLHNVMNSTIEVFRENRLLDMHELEAAGHAAERLLGDEYTVVGIYKSLLKLDRLYIDLVMKKEADLSFMREKEMKTFIRTMKAFPSVIRTEYAAALAQQPDGEKAKKCLERFEKIAKSYPTAADIESERELMRLAEEVLSNR